MASEVLLDHVPVGNVHRIRGELPPEEAAEAYEEELRMFFRTEDVPRFDLILLGLGADGHTASLFPENSALEIDDRWVVANPVPKLDTTRITFTVPVINAARAIIFLVAGEDKAEALGRSWKVMRTHARIGPSSSNPPAAHNGCSTSPPRHCLTVPPNAIFGRVLKSGGFETRPYTDRSYANAP